MNPKVSILIISYNEKDYLPQAINSCLSQSYDNIEIIIGDDGSNDGSLEYINSLGNDIRHFVMQRDNNPVIASIRVSNVIRRGLDEALGKYFIILSGDDYFIDHSFISEAVDFLENHNEYIAFVNGFQRVDATGNFIDSSVLKQQSNSVYWSGNYTHISCFVFRKINSSDFLNRMNDDTGFEFVLACKGKWKYCSREVLAYRQRNNSIQHEVDRVELSILEIMLLQDVLNYNCKKLSFATLSRFYRPLSYLSEHNDDLKNPKYEKYFINCKKYENDVLDSILCNKSILNITKMRFMYRYYSIIRKLKK